MASTNSLQHQEVTIKRRRNLRGIKECFIARKHVSLRTLKERMLQVFPRDPMTNYLTKEIPLYPTPVEFWVSNVAHVTGESGFEDILESNQFRPPVSELSWWGLKINEEEIKSAEKRYMEENFLNQSQELRPFLEKFTTSPVFQLEKSHYGNYRFIFPLTDLMQWYKEQNCGGEEPVLRVHRTVTYKQQIMYTVLIHSPEDNERFREYPLLEESEWVRYQDGKIIWKAQAICETHRYQFVSQEVQRLNTRRFYVWDQVSLAFHLPIRTNPIKILKIPRERLIRALEACKLDEKIDLSRYQGNKTKEERFLDAKMKVSELKRARRGLKRKGDQYDNTQRKKMHDCEVAVRQ